MGLVNRVPYFALKNVDACRRLANRLVTKTSDCIVLPCSDSPLTDEIMAGNYGSLSICERDDQTRAEFEPTIQRTKSRTLRKPNVHIYSDDLFSHGFNAQDDNAQNRYSEIIRIGRLSAEKTSGATCNSSSIKLVFPLVHGKYERSLLKSLYYQVSLKLGPCSHTLIDYYLLISDRSYTCLTAKPGGSLANYRALTVLYNTFFKIHHIDQYNLKDCFEIGLRQLQSTAKSKSALYQNVHSARWEPNAEILNEVDSSFMMEYKFFIYQIMSKRKALIVPAVENWFRGCHRDLAKIGLSSETKVGEVDVEHFIKLFKYLRSRPDYKSSPLRQAMALTENTNLFTSNDQNNL